MFAEGSLLPEAGEVFYSAAERKAWFEPASIQAIGYRSGSFSL